MYWRKMEFERERVRERELIKKHGTAEYFNLMFIIIWDVDCSKLSYILILLAIVVHGLETRFEKIKMCSRGSN